MVGLGKEGPAGDAASTGCGGVCERFSSVGCSDAAQAAAVVGAAQVVGLGHKRGAKAWLDMLFEDMVKAKPRGNVYQDNPFLVIGPGRGYLLGGYLEEDIC